MTVRSDDPTPEEGRRGFRFIPTLSWDSVAALLALAISGFLYVQTIKTDQAVQAKDIQALQKSVDRVETDMKERQRAAENQQEKRSERLEAIVKDNSRVLQDALQQLRR